MPYIIVRLAAKQTTQKLDIDPHAIRISEDGKRFRLNRIIKQGFNGVVFSGEEIDAANKVVRSCAIKVLKHLDSPREDRFHNEVRILRQLSHKNISGFYGNGSASLQYLDVPWVAMDLGEQDLRDFMDEANAPLDLQGVRDVSLQIANALEHLHSKKIIHRDVKPDNFIFSNAKDYELMMIDFGIAKFVHDDTSARPLDNFTIDSEKVGPVHFFSPELIAYGRDKSVLVDHRSDIFQFGKMIWFFATNAIPAGIISKKKDPTGGKLYDLVYEMLAEDPADRPPDIAAVRARLKAVF